jgi:hypothetical protein
MIPKKKTSCYGHKDEKNGETDYLIGIRSPTGFKEGAFHVLPRDAPQVRELATQTAKAWRSAWSGNVKK